VTRRSRLIFWGSVAGIALLQLGQWFVDTYLRVSIAREMT
jgi:hypothetical protein